MILKEFTKLLLELPNFTEKDSFSLGPLSFSNSPQCPINLPLTCSNHTAITDTCCFEYPGGVFLQTQFWDYTPSRANLDNDTLERELGPLDSFTIHGLWPDNCDGGYGQFCDNSLAIDDVHYLLNSEQFNCKENLEISGKDLLKKLNTLWKSNTGNDESLWIHEFNKHGTCIKTIRPICYTRWNSDGTDVLSVDYDGYKKQAVYDYFRVAFNLYSKLNTFEILQKHGITPSVDATYSRKQIQDALANEFGGKQVYIGCDSRNALNEIWYFHLLQGSLLGEDFKRIDSFKTFGRCKVDRIKFYPKGYIPSNNGRLTPGEPGSSMRGLIGLSGVEGHLIKNGRWIVKGIPANFELIKAPFGNYYLKSRTGYCRLSNSNAIVCNKNINNASQFDYDAQKGYLGYSSSYEWSAEEYPRDNKQSLVYANKELN